jgi:DNA-binding Lrp family transcriptional regulator
MLLTNSRLPYHELASKLGISVNAVHKRIMEMSDAGIIRAFTARPSAAADGVLTVWVFGRSEAPSAGLHEKLHADDSTYWVGLAGGNFVYVGAYLRDLSRLERYVSFVRREAQIADPTVGILPELTRAPGAKTLYPLDYQIINALHKDSRKPLSEVAEELHVSAKTVRRRLEAMLVEGLAELSMEWYPDASDDIITMFHLRLGPSTETNKAVNSLLATYAPHILFPVNFSNLPNLLLCFAWTNTMKELKGLKDRLQAESMFESVMPNVLYTGFIFDTWRDDLLAERAAPRR